MRSYLLCVGLFSLFILASYGNADPPVKNGDWPQWRGPLRNAISTETGLLKVWPKGGPKLLWDSNTVNGGHSIETSIASLAIVEGRIYTMGDHLIKEEVDVKKGDTVTKKAVYKGDGFLFCVDADTGKEIWKTRIGPAYYNSYGSGGLHSHHRRRSALRHFSSGSARMRQNQGRRDPLAERFRQGVRRPYDVRLGILRIANRGW
jgi:hypothetical protein